MRGKMKVGSKTILCMLVTLILMMPISACEVSRVQNTSQLPMQIEIEIHGGFGITVFIKNLGEENLSNLDLEIDLNGLVFIVGGGQGIIISLPSGEKEVMLRLFILGIGPGTIGITVEDAYKVADFFVIGPFVII